MEKCLASITSFLKVYLVLLLLLVVVVSSSISTIVVFIFEQIG